MKTKYGFGLLRRPLCPHSSDATFIVTNFQQIIMTLIEKAFEAAVMAPPWQLSSDFYTTPGNKAQKDNDENTGRAPICVYIPLFSCAFRRLVDMNVNQLAQLPVLIERTLCVRLAATDSRRHLETRLDDCSFVWWWHHWDGNVLSAGLYYYIIPDHIAPWHEM